MANYTEDALIEQPSIALLSTLGWETFNAYHETFSPDSLLGWENAGEVVLFAHLLPALERLNPGFSPEVLRLAADELSRDRSSLSLAEANREVYQMLKDGARVTYRDDEGTENT